MFKALKKACPSIMHADDLVHHQKGDLDTQFVRLA
jgi:hypothetical protein